MTLRLPEIFLSGPLPVEGAVKSMVLRPQTPERSGMVDVVCALKADQLPAMATAPSKPHAREIERTIQGSQIGCPADYTPPPRHTLPSPAPIFSPKMQRLTIRRR